MKCYDTKDVLSFTLHYQFYVLRNVFCTLRYYNLFELSQALKQTLQVVSGPVYISP